jgi:hypothetical protein
MVFNCVLRTSGSDLRRDGGNPGKKNVIPATAGIRGAKLTVIYNLN